MSNNTDFVKKVIEPFLFADILLHYLNNKHIKKLFYSLPSETMYRKTVLQLRVDELQWLLYMTDFSRY